MATESSTMDQLAQRSEEEQTKTTAHRIDVKEFFSHDTSTTRLELVVALRLRADVIEAEALTDRSITQMTGLGQ